jgi:hypothetical protein
MQKRRATISMARLPNERAASFSAWLNIAGEGVAPMAALGH